MIIANELTTVFAQLCMLALFGFLGAVVFRQDFKLNWFVGALILYVIYDGLLTRGFLLIPNYPINASWNWLGKVMSIAGMFAIVSLPYFKYREVGLTFEQRPGFRAPLLVFVILIVLFGVLALLDDSPMADMETIAFQWTMPSLDEELFYRGILLLMMNEAFTRKFNVLGAPISYGGLITSLLFGLAHGFGYSESGFYFEPMTVAITGIPSLALLWLRERTGSLLLPILAHCASNGLFTVI